MSKKIQKYYSFHYAGVVLKLVKNDNFYSVIMNRRVLGSSVDLLGAQKLFTYFISKMVFSPFNFDIQQSLSDFDSAVMFSHHRNGFNKNFNNN